MKICHFSDIHFRLSPGEMTLHEMLCAKRLFGGLNYFFRKKKFADDRKKFSLFRSYLNRESFDCLLFTGDFTSLGLTAELHAARKLFEPLLKGPDPLLFLAGNHDRYARDAGSSAFFDIFSDELDRWARPIVPGLMYPKAFALGNAMFFIQNTALPNGMPANASGSIPRRELDALCQALRSSCTNGKMSFILGHHGLSGAGSKLFPFLHGLNQAEELTAVIRQAGKAVYVHGHVHRSFIQEIVPGSAYAICAGSLTHQGRESFWKYELNAGKFTAWRGFFDGSEYRLESQPALSFQLNEFHQSEEMKCA